MSRIYSIIIAAALIGNMALCLPYHPVSSSFYKHPAIESLREKMLDNYLKINNMVGFNEIPNRIIGGVAAAKGEAPFLTQLYRKFVFSYQFLCGGSLITSRTVLSAAHCVSMISNYRIRYGTNSRVWSPYEDAEVKEVKPHPDFDLSTIQNDIALFILKNPIPPSANVKAIELESEQVKANSSAVLFGFGLTDSSTKTPAIKLQKITQFLLDDDECEEFVSKLNVKKGPGMFCTTSPDSSACNGDSGGPLVNGKNGKQIGIVSFGTRRCPPSSINVYTNVTYYLDWINKNKVD